jgi:hypothetical protein
MKVVKPGVTGQARALFDTTCDVCQRGNGAALSQAMDCTGRFESGIAHHHELALRGDPTMRTLDADPAEYGYGENADPADTTE